MLGPCVLVQLPYINYIAIRHITLHFIHTCIYSYNYAYIYRQICTCIDRKSLYFLVVFLESPKAVPSLEKANAKNSVSMGFIPSNANSQSAHVGVVLFEGVPLSSWL